MEVGCKGMANVMWRRGKWNELLDLSCIMYDT